MSRTQVFVSHSSQDSHFSDQLVEGLTNAGADVWYDKQNLTSGVILDVIDRQLDTGPRFVAVLSPAAIASDWVFHECRIAYMQYLEQGHNGVIVPVTAQHIDNGMFHGKWLFMRLFKRIEAPGGTPLPVSQALAQTIRALDLNTETVPSAARLAQPQSGKTVLWVDDIPSNNYFERRYLEKRGLNVTISTSTDDALGKLIRHRYTAIISDMARPGDDKAGYTLLEWARKLGVNTPFILYTSSQHPHHVTEAKRRGALGQTSAPDELVRLVKQALSIS